MSARRRLVWILMGWMVVGSTWGQDLDLYVRSTAADGRIRVVAREAEWVPRLSMWSERSMERLEKEWKLTLPFEPQVPLDIRIVEEGEALQLVQAMQGRSLRQLIRIPSPPEDVSAQDMSETFVQAMIARLLWSAGKDGSALQEEIERTAWMAGMAAELVPGKAGLLAEEALERFADSPPPSPEVVQPDDVVASFLLSRWMQGTALQNRETSRVFWTRYVHHRAFQVEDWVAVTPEVSSLRDLHISWELWWAAERHLMIGEFQLTGPARFWLVEELNPIPRFFGLDAADLSSLKPTSLAGFGAYVNHPGIEPALIQWMYRLQAVRFRQPAALNYVIRSYEEALEQALVAARSRPDDRKRRWEQAVEMWNEAESSISP